MRDKYRFFSSRLWKVALVTALAGLVVFLNPYRLFDPFRYAFSLAVYPFQKAAYQTSAFFSSAKDFFGSLGRIKQENERLVEENLRLIAANAKREEVESENAELRQQLSLVPRDQYQLEGAFVISRDPHGLGNWIEIDKGEKDGLREGMAVIVADGILIGKIGAVQSGSAQVVLVTSPQSLINAFDVKTGAKGIVIGEYELGSILDMVLQGDVLNQGDEIVTAGSAEGMPQGLLIGKVEKVGLSNNGLFQQAIISLPVKFSGLRVVFVVKN